MTSLYTPTTTTLAESLTTMANIVRDVTHAMNGDVRIHITYDGVRIAPKLPWTLTADEKRTKADHDIARIVRFVKAFGPLEKQDGGYGMQLVLQLHEAEIVIDASDTCERVEVGTKKTVKKRPACPECQAELETLDGGDQACAERGADHFFRAALPEIEEEVDVVVYENRCTDSVLKAKL